MAAITQDEVVQNEIIQDRIKDVVRIALETPFGDSIIEAVEEASEQQLEEVAESSRRGWIKSNSKKAMQGLIVFSIMFVVLYMVFRHFSNSG